MMNDNDHAQPASDSDTTTGIGQPPGETPQPANSIPVLEDVVSTGLPAENKTTSLQGMELLQNERLQGLEKRLATQLMDKLDATIQTSIGTAVERASSNLQQVIKDELYHSLQKGLDELLKTAIQEHLAQLEKNRSTQE